MTRLLAAALLVSACAYVPIGSRPAEARVRLVDASSVELGVGKLTETRGGVRLELRLRGAAPGTHGMHVHTVGLCEPPQFTSAGGHFNPTRKQHGFKNPAGPHLGDLPNVVVKDDGTAKVDVVLPGVTITPGPTSLFHAGGTALVLHRNQDDDITEPAGNAGPRVACGVITLKK